MKIVTHIFIIYIFALSLVPCGGGNGIVEIAKHLLGVEHQHLSVYDQYATDCCDNICTPFCVCSCSMALDIPQKSSFLISYQPLTSTKLFSSYSSLILSSFHQFIFKPPRFS